MSRKMIDVAALKARYDLKDYIAQDLGYAQMHDRWHGNVLKIRCPFHDDRNPSMTVYDERYKCYACGESGDILDYICKRNNVDFITAVNTLEDHTELNPHIQFSPKKDKCRYSEKKQAQICFDVTLTASKNKHKAQEYLVSRGIDQRMTDKYSLGWFDIRKPFEARGGSAMRNRRLAFELDYLWDDGRFKFYDNFIIPVFDVEAYHYPVFFCSRNVYGESDSKYVNHLPPYLKNKAKKFIFGAQVCEPDSMLFVVEGFFDVFALRQIGLNAVSLMGTSMTPEKARGIVSISHDVHILLDGDDAGFDASDDAAQIIDEETYADPIVHDMPKGYDPHSLIVEKNITSLKELAEYIS